MSCLSCNKTFVLVFVDDNPGDLLIFTETLRRQKIFNPSILFECSKNALKFFKQAPRPDHILITDIDLPIYDGFELMKRVKKTKGNQDIKTIALTSNEISKEYLIEREPQPDKYCSKDKFYWSLIRALTEFSDVGSVFVSPLEEHPSLQVVRY